MKNTEAPDTTPATAVDPVLYEPPTVEINGTTYTLRRLGLPDVFRVIKILGRGAALLDPDANFTGAQVLQVLITSLAINEAPVLDLIASLLSVDRAALDDPEQFPLDSVIPIVEAISRHGDLTAFLSKVNTFSARMPNIATTNKGKRTGKKKPD